MSTNHYAMPFGKRFFHDSPFFTTHFEPFILSLFLLMGCIGTFYLFGQKIFQPEQISQQPNGSSFLSTVFFADAEDDLVDGDFDKYVEIGSKQSVGQRFSFTFTQDYSASRYVMEMGDGVRLIVTQPNLSYQYNTPGKYTIELKEIKNGLLNLVGTKTIKVK